MNKTFLFLTIDEEIFINTSEAADGDNYPTVGHLFWEMASGIGLIPKFSNFETVDGPMITGLGSYQTDPESGHGFIIRFYLADGTSVEPDCDLMSFDGISPDDVVGIVVREVAKWRDVQ